MTTSYERYLVLEYGIDHPGEMDFLLSIAEPDIAIISPVAVNHIEQFGSLGVYRAEKLKLINPENTIAIVHESLRQYVDREAYFYSTGGLSDITVSQVHIEKTGTR